MASEAFLIMQSTFASLSYYMACSLDHASSLNIKGLKHTPPPTRTECSEVSHTKDCCLYAYYIKISNCL